MINKSEIKQFKQLINEWNKSKSFTEKSIEFSYYELINTYFKNKYEDDDLIKIKYNSPYSSDGIITVERNKIDYSILIEAKYDKNYNNKNDLITVLCQAIYYLKRLENEQELLPAIILLVSKKNTAIIRTEQVINYLFNDYDWDEPANQAYNNTNLYNSLLNNKEIYPIIFNILEDDINNYLNTVDNYCNNSIFTSQKKVNYSLNNHQLQILEDYSEYALMLKFNDYYNNNYFYNVNNDKWYAYNGKYWEPNNHLIIKEKILIYLSNISREIEGNNSIYYFRISQKLTTMNMVNNIYDLLILYTSKNILLDKSTISLINGDYNFNEKKLLAHAKNNYSLFYYNYEYNGDSVLLYNIIGEKELANNDLFLAWFNEMLETDSTSFITTTDLLTSFNEWSAKRNNSGISARYFHETLRNHKIYFDNNLQIKAKSRVLNGMKQSSFKSSNPHYENAYYESGDKCTYVTGIKFR